MLQIGTGRVEYTFQKTLIEGVSFSSEMSSSKIYCKLVLYKCWLQPGGFKPISAYLLPLFTWAYERVPCCSSPPGNPYVWNNCPPAEPRFQVLQNLYMSKIILKDKTHFYWNMSSTKRAVLFSDKCVKTFAAHCCRTV